MPYFISLNNFANRLPLKIEIQVCAELRSAIPKDSGVAKRT